MNADSVDTSTMSAECAVAHQPGYAGLHDECRQTEDVPLPNGAASSSSPAAPAPTTATPPPGDAPSHTSNQRLSPTPTQPGWGSVASWRRS